MVYQIEEAMIEIDITAFDVTDNSRVEYALTERQFNEPLKTLLELVEAPEVFQKRVRKYRLVLTKGQNRRLLSFLASRKLKLENFGNPKNAQFLLALSFGEGSVVNDDLSKIVELVNKKHPSLILAAQWEIADTLLHHNPGLKGYVHRIEKDRGKEYITTVEVVDQFMENITQAKKLTEKPKVFIVAQAWHAPRCIHICRAKGLDAVGGEFSELFSPNDSQPWVRDAFHWVLKEGTVSS